jgi:hypothetical protein
LINLSQNDYQLAKEYIQMHARGLERARFRFLFENGSKDDVMAELEKYQNNDGGFGHGIEPDYWTPHSSPMATWAAGRILNEVAADKDESIIKGMLSYLLKTQDAVTGMWPSVVPEINDFPHAPWWHWEENAQANWSFNPGAELAAFLVKWSDEGSVAAEAGWNSISKAIGHLMGEKVLDKHQINNYQQLVKLMKPYESIFNQRMQFLLNEVAAQVINLAVDCIEMNPQAWKTGYKPLPFDFIEGPNDEVFKKLEQLANHNIEFYINELSGEGVWDISWEWGQDQENFEKARKYWKGILLVERFKKLKEFGYLEVPNGIL